MPVDKIIQDKLDQLNREFYARLPKRFSKLNALWVDFHGGISEALNHVCIEVHNLGGSGASFGYPEVSRLASVLEKTLKLVVSGDRSKETMDKANIMMAQLVTFRSHHEKETEVFYFEKISKDLSKSSVPIFLIDDDELFIEKMAIELAAHHYDVIKFLNLDDAVEASKQFSPAVVIMDMMFPEGDSAGAEAINKMRAYKLGVKPAIFISSRDDIEARLAAVRAGSDSYFVKPVNVSELVDRLDVIVARAHVDAYRVLIVDDDEILGERYVEVLESVGLEAELVTDPICVMPTLVSLKPDLMLVDLHMPGCSGIELSAVLRQHKAYQNIPIIFLSNERDVEKQYEARNCGVDDYLLKPIDDAHLISTVSNRAYRSRLLNSKIITESLTGLLTRDRFLTELDRHMFLAKRNNRSFCYAMLDIDHFKDVNDTYGHLCGDAVLKNFSNVLKNRLRGSDLIGRYGGEEFGIIFPDTKLEDSLVILNALREKFSLTTHILNGNPIVTTFSGGVAEYDHSFATKEMIIDAADKALYRAKNSGRNRVLVHNSF